MATKKSQETMQKALKQKGKEYWSVVWLTPTGEAEDFFEQLVDAAKWFAYLEIRGPVEEVTLYTPEGFILEEKGGDIDG